MDAQQVPKLLTPVVWDMNGWGTKEGSVKSVVSGQAVLLPADVSFVVMYNYVIGLHKGIDVLINVFCVHVVIDCGGLPSPDNGEVDFSRTTFGAMAFYSCDPGYFLQGFSKRTCQADGSWSNDEPTCECKFVL